VSTILELLASPGRREFAGEPETDALTEVDGLQEADLLDVRYSLDDAKLAMLFDIRIALGFRLANTAVLIMGEVSTIELSCRHTDWLHRSHTVIDSIPAPQDGLFTFELRCLDGWAVRAVSHTAEWFVGNIPGLPDAQPDFHGDEAAIAAGMPAWTSEFEPGWATFLDPAPR
jgi:hypothetical protein